MCEHESFMVNTLQCIQKHCILQISKCRTESLLFNIEVITSKLYEVLNTDVNILVITFQINKFNLINEQLTTVTF